MPALSDAQGTKLKSRSHCEPKLLQIKYIMSPANPKPCLPKFPIIYIYIPIENNLKILPASLAFEANTITYLETSFTAALSTFYTVYIKNIRLPTNCAGILRTITIGNLTVGNLNVHSRMCRKQKCTVGNLRCTKSNHRCTTQYCQHSGVVYCKAPRPHIHICKQIRPP